MDCIYGALHVYVHPFTLTSNTADRLTDGVPHPHLGIINQLFIQQKSALWPWLEVIVRGHLKRLPRKLQQNSCFIIIMTRQHSQTATNDSMNFITVKTIVGIGGKRFYCLWISTQKLCIYVSLNWAECRFLVSLSWSNTARWWFQSETFSLTMINLDFSSYCYYYYKN